MCPFAGTPVGVKGRRRVCGRMEVTHYLVYLSANSSGEARSQVANEAWPTPISPTLTSFEGDMIVFSTHQVFGPTNEKVKWSSQNRLRVGSPTITNPLKNILPGQGVGGGGPCLVSPTWTTPQKESWNLKPSSKATPCPL